MARTGRCWLAGRRTICRCVIFSTVTPSCPMARTPLANYNRFCETGDDARWQKTLKAADWLAVNLEQNAHELWVWNHHFDWDYRDKLKAPWYSGLAQGQGVSLLLRAHALSEEGKYQL